MNTDINTADALDMLIDDILAYLEGLNKQFAVSIHGLDQILGPYFPRFLPFNTHMLPLCMYVKSRESTMPMCVRCQRFAIAHAKKRGAFLGTCFFGMAEFVFPIPQKIVGSGCCGIISVSGYREAQAIYLKKAKCAARHTWVEEDMLISFIKQTTTKVMPPIKEIRTHIRPLIHMITLLVHLIEQLNINTPCVDYKQEDFFTRVSNYLGTHYRSPHLSMDTIAKKHHCSISYISHMFKTKSGLSLRTYINALRIRDATMYLTHTNLPIGEIAYIVGYQDSNYFSTVFKKEAGCSPSLYRKRHTHPSSADSLLNIEGK